MEKNTDKIFLKKTKKVNPTMPCKKAFLMLKFISMIIMTLRKIRLFYLDKLCVGSSRILVVGIEPLWETKKSPERNNFYWYKHNMIKKEILKIW